MAATHYIKAGDTLPVLRVALRNPDGTPTDLAGKTLVLRFSRKNPANGTLTRQLSVVGAAADGVAEYAWVAGDWTGPTPIAPGIYRVEYLVEQAGTSMTFPNDGYDLLTVTARLP